MSPRSLIVTCLFWAAIPTILHAATRIAIIAPEPSEAIQKAVAIAEVKLSDDRSLQLVERQQIRQFLSEQAASLGGIIQADKAVAAGRILSADLLAAVESDPKSPAVAGLVIFDAATGVRYHDSALIPGDGEKTATTIASAIASAAAKRLQAGRGLHTVCLLSVRNADMPRSMDGLCDAAGRLFLRELPASPSVAVLERSRLEQINKERAIAPQAANSNLLASLVTADLDLARDGAASTRGNVVLTDSQGKTLARVSAASGTDEAAKLTHALAEAVANSLKAAPPAGAPDAKAEAARFYREAVLLAEHRDFIRALPPAEAAHALDPGDLVSHALLASVLVDCGDSIFKSQWYSGPTPHEMPLVPKTRPDDILPWLQRGTEMMLGVGLQRAQATPRISQAVHPHLRRCIRTLDQHLGSVFAIQRGPRIAEVPPGPQFASLLALIRRYQLEVEHPEALAELSQTNAFSPYCRHMGSLLDGSQWLFSRDAHEWTSDMAVLVEEFLREYDKRPPSEAEMGADVLHITAIGWRKRGNYFGNLGRRSQWDLDAGDYERLKSLAAKMLAHADLRVQAYGQLFRTALDVDRAKSAAAMRDIVAEFFRYMKPRTIDPKTDNNQRMRCYGMMLDATALLDKTELRGTLDINLLEFMLSQNDLFDQVANRVLMGVPDRPALIGRDDPRRAVLAAQILAVLDSPQHRLVYTAGRELRSLCESAVSTTRPTGVIRTNAPGVPQYHRLADVIDAESGMQWIIEPVLNGQDLYAVGLTPAPNRQQHELRLLRFILPDGRLEQLGRLPDFGTVKSAFISKPRIESRSGQPNPCATAACFLDGHYYLATIDCGVVVFSTTDAAPVTINARNGLPSACISAIAALDGKVYAGAGKPSIEGYLLALDPKSHACDVLASSLRKEKRSPFDDGGPFAVKSITPDPPRHRLLLAIERRGTGSEISGLWEFVPRTGQWRCLLPIEVKTILSPNGTSGISTGIEGACGIDVDRILVASSLSKRFFDLKRDQPEPLLFKYDPYNPVVLMDGWLWGVRVGPGDLCRRCLATGEQQILPKPRELGRTYRPRYLLPAGAGRLITGDSFGLFVID